MLRLILAAGFLLLFSPCNRVPAADKELPRVPEGFTIEVAAEAPLVKHPMLAGFDDRGRLFVAESAGQNLRAAELLKNPPNFIRMLEDTNGDGRFDRSTIFADKMTLPMGALWYRGALYVASPPSIWRLEDTNGDGVADRREEIVNTFGFTGNAASIHGCFLGPCGRIYWCDGRHGHEFHDGQGQITSQGKAARIFSCRPDGTDVEVFCGGGMDNPVEVDFLPTGEMLGTVNILIGRPRVDCLMHWIAGGVYPRADQQDCIAEFQRTGDLLPPMTRLGHVAVSGMTRYRSTAFGPAYQNDIFTTIFNTHQVIRSVVERSGATFRTREEDFFVSDNPDCHPTDVLEDADGSLLVIDTGGWFRIGCPTSQVAKPEVLGTIYRIRRKDAPAVNDPRGLSLRLPELPPEQLVRYLDDERPAVRARAIDRLALAGDAAIPSLRQVLADPKESQYSDQARRNAVWSLSRIETATALAPLRSALNDSSDGVRMAAARSLGIRRDIQAIERLAQLVSTDSPAVRRSAATALGRISEVSRADWPENQRKPVIDALFATLTTSDRYLEHAALYAVIRMADRERTSPFLRHPSPQIRRTALIALDQMEGGQLTRDLVTPLLDTDDPALQNEALRIIGQHPGWAGETLQLLRDWLTQAKLTDDQAAVLRGVLLAQQEDETIQKLLAEAWADSQTTPEIRLLLLEVIDRSTLPDLPAGWQTALQAALADTRTAVRLQAIRIIRARGLDRFDQRLHQLARHPDQPNAVRVESIFALAPRLKSLEPPLFDYLTGHFKQEISPLTQLAAARAIADAPLNDAQLIRLARMLEGAGPLAVPVLLRAFARSQSRKVGMAMVAALQKSSAASNLSPEELARLLDNYPSDVQTAARDLLDRLGVDLARQRARLQELAPVLEGGDAARGRQIFFGKQAACASCHTIDREGARVGPDLTTIGAIRTSRDLLEAVVFPSASFAREYRSYMIVTRQGRVHTGVISRQTAERLVLRTTELEEIRIPREDILEMKESSVSIMPKGLDQTLTLDELRDLMAYLASRK